MSFFDKILSGLGFEGEEKAKAEKNKPQKKQKAGEYIFQEEKVIPEYRPKDNDEVLKVVDLLKKEKTVVVDLSFFDQADAEEFLSFLSGAVYALCGDIVLLDEKKYKLVVD